jgi:hypothetical protein
VFKAKLSFEVPAAGQERQSLLVQLQSRRGQFNRGSKKWSAALYGSTVVIALSSAVAGILPKINDSDSYENAALVLGVVGAVVATLTSQIRFGHKRAANRNARAAIDGLTLSVTYEDMSVPEASRELREILKTQSDMVTGPLDADVDQAHESENKDEGG